MDSACLSKETLKRAVTDEFTDVHLQRRVPISGSGTPTYLPGDVGHFTKTLACTDIACTDIACTITLNLSLNRGSSASQLGKRTASRVLFPDASGCDGVQAFLEQAEHKVRNGNGEAQSMLRSGYPSCTWLDNVPTLRVYCTSTNDTKNSWANRLTAD
jgi:hypothetical protein